uniref:Uncharacterized protein n=1 Tax=Meloidogyne hapla TaxID=6305 RepID=A0A1I8BF23_MELHA
MAEQKNITESTPPISKTVIRRLLPLRHSRLLQFNERTRTRPIPHETTENVKTRTQTTSINANEPKKTTARSTDVLDYYDMFVILSFPNIC